MIKKFGKAILAMALMTGMLVWSTPPATYAANSVGLDKGLEAAVREQIALNDAIPLSEDEIGILTALNIQAKHGARSLEGLQSAAFLKEVTIEGNKAVDLSALLKLPSLTKLVIQEEALDKAAKAVIEKLREKGVAVSSGENQQQAQPIQVFIDGEPLGFTKEPLIVNGTTMVQFRPLFESFGLDIGWDDASRTVTGTKDRLRIELVIGSKAADVSGTEVTLPIAPTLMNGNTMIPLRFVGEATGRSVFWDGETRTINIYSSITSYNLDILYANETVYEGESANGVPQGMGKLLYNGELFYEGQFKDGKIEGRGKMYDIEYPSSYYEGEFKNNRFHGEGKMVYSDEGYHIGSYSNGLREGSGKLLYKDGTLSYEGMFQDNAIHGEGTGYYGNYKYVGAYAYGSFSGQGKLYYQGDLDYDGLWKDNRKFQGITYSQGKPFYEGTYLDDKPDGYGAFYGDNGKVRYRGQVRSYQTTGVGILYYENGDRYIGQVYNGVADGKGILKDAKGAVKYDGYYKDGEIDPDPSATAQSADAIRKMLIGHARHSYIDGYYPNDLGLTSQQAVMFITLESEDHVKQFNQLPEDAQVRLINEYAQGHWGDILGVDECFTYIVYGKNVYAEAVLNYDMQNEDVELMLYPAGNQIFE